MLKIILTDDGSSSIFNQELEETYHSVQGAIQESKHVFIQQGLSNISEKNGNSVINILEVGLGTGLNVLLTLLYSSENNLKISYSALEPYPLKADLIKELNYEDLLKNYLEENILNKIAICEWQKEIEIGKNFTFTKYKTRLQDFESNQQFHLIYYDAFAPSKQAEMWELNCFKKLYSYLVNNGILVSYCASGQFKRNLSASGFMVESLTGPPGKREMCRGIKRNKSS